MAPRAEGGRGHGGRRGWGGRPCAHGPLLISLAVPATRAPALCKQAGNGTACSSWQGPSLPSARERRGEVPSAFVLLCVVFVDAAVLGVVPCLCACLRACLLVRGSSRARRCLPGACERELCQFWGVWRARECVCFAIPRRLPLHDGGDETARACTRTGPTTGERPARYRPRPRRVARSSVGRARPCVRRSRRPREPCGSHDSGSSLCAVGI